MTIPVVMPQMGESLSEGTIIKWHKKPGDSVDRDEPLFEISTDKVDTEVPAPAAGVVARILVNEGETVAVGTVVAEIGDAATVTATAPRATAASEIRPADTAPASPTATAATTPSSPSGSAATPPSATTAKTDQPSEGGGHFRSAHEPQTFQRKRARAPSQPGTITEPAPPTATRSGEHRGRLSPAVLSLAARNEIPLDELLEIPGSGRGGRITKKDVERYLSQRSASPKRPAPAPGGLTPAGAAIVSGAAPPDRYLYRPEPTDKLVPMSDVRRQIAEHMLASQQISAQVTSFAECDMHRIVRYRDEESARFEEREGVPLTFLPFIAEAAIAALKQFPIFNASVVGDQIALKKHIHLGIAVSLAEGLIAPVIHQADDMSFVGLARSIHERTERARTGGLAPEEVRGASFTITTPGMFGGLMGTPMIAQPQVAILGLGAVQKKPVVIDDAIGIRPIMVLALTFDHRVIDGATAFQFLEQIRLRLESFELP